MSRTEEERRQLPRNSTTINLNAIAGISVGDSILTHAEIEQDEQKWRGSTFLIGAIIEENLNISDIDLLRLFCYESLPFVITGDTTLPKPTLLKAELARFPYSINGKKAYNSFGIRLMPQEGRIAEITFNEEHRMAVNRFVATPDGIDADLGNGSIHVQILYSPKEELPTITPPQGFQEEVILPKDSSYD